LTAKLAAMVKAKDGGSAGDPDNCDELVESSVCTQESEHHQNEPSDLPNLCGPGEEPLQLVGCKPGDVVFLHPDTAHCGGPNYCQHEDAGGQIRIMIYFRLKSNGFRLLPPIHGTDTERDVADSTMSQAQRLNWSEICEHCKHDLFFDLPGLARE
jgi:ectoine hydroxylase-related dioxygenase (phytanoyl-CoA dioxygenase family)